MRIDDLHSAIASPQQVDSTFLKDWEELMQQYPYFNAGHIILAKASHVAGHLDYETRLHKAALYTGDRKQLYDIIHGEQLREKIADITAEVDDLAEEAIDVLQEETQPDEAQVEEPVMTEELPTIEEEPQSEAEIVSDTEERITDEELAELEEEILYEAVHSSIEQEVDPSRDQDSSTEIATDQEEGQKAIDTPAEDGSAEPMSPFAAWLKDRATAINYDMGQEEVKTHSIAESTSTEKENAKTGTSQDPGSIIDAFIKNDPKITPRKTDLYSTENLGKMSLVEDEDFVTETLAKVYIKQGKIGKARKIYKKLSLKYPEKSIYFANQLKKLDNKT